MSSTPIFASFSPSFFAVAGSYGVKESPEIYAPFLVVKSPLDDSCRNRGVTRKNGREAPLRFLWGGQGK